MKKSITLTILFFVFNYSLAQYIEGKVLDAQTNKPIEGVHVYVEGINRGTLTNEKGNYYLKFPFQKIKSDIIRFSHISYETIQIPYNSKKKEYSVFLRAKTETLDEIKLVEKRKLKSTLKFETLSEMKKGVYAFGAVLNKDKIYVIGGDGSYKHNDYLKKLEQYENDEKASFTKLLQKASVNYEKSSFKGNAMIYDISNDSWTFEKNAFRKRAYHQIQLVDNQIYILGGKRLTRTQNKEYLDDKVEIYDLSNKTLEVDDINPHQAVDFASFVYKGNIIVMGGSIKQNKLGIRKYTNTVHSLNIKSGLWYHIGNMPVPKETQGQLIGDKFYLIGGFDGKSLTSIESFNLKTGRWKQEGELFSPMEKPALTSNNDIIYIFESGKLLTFNTSKKIITEYLVDIYLLNAEMFFYNDKLYIIGGEKYSNSSNYPSRSVYSIDILELNKTKINNFKTI